jgi:hypothetical protein
MPGSEGLSPARSERYRRLSSGAKQTFSGALDGAGCVVGAGLPATAEIRSGPGLW